MTARVVLIARQAVELAVAATVGLFIAGCPTSPNPRACVNSDAKCPAGFRCVSSKGASWCVPDDTDASPGSDARIADAPVAGDSGRQTDLPVVDTASVDSAMPQQDASSPDGPGLSDAPISTGPDGGAKSPMGARCSQGSECLTQVCSDGVCCDRACTGQCEACDAAGRCQLVTGDPVGGRQLCRGQGECKGTCSGSTAQCALPDATKACGAPASCSNAVITPGGRCDGNGVCTAPASAACPGGFACADISRCATSCMDSSDCATAAYCAGQTCHPKKPLGAVCSTFEECGSATCGGRCCSSGCTCPQPSAGNRFQNAGFDSDLTNWCPSGSLQWTNDDADGCPYSGAAKTVTTSGCPTQCAQVAQGAYYLGGLFKSPSGNMYVCIASVWSSPGCTGTDVTPASPELLSGAETTWTFHRVRIDVPANAASLRINCEARPDTQFDKLFLSPVPGGF
jgi:hypothetical protein